jgi:hypothetical protein
MRLPTAYDPFYLNRNQGLRKGRISVNPTAGIDASLGVKWWNSQESGNDFILITDNYSTGRTNNINDGTPLFYPMGRTQANILTTVNGLRNSPKGFTTSGSALEFLAQSGYFIIDPNNPPPQLVTSGSIVYLDSRQIMSFPTTGSGWYDMSGWSNNAILTTCSFSSSAITFPSPASAVTINYITQSTEGMTISFNARMKKPLAAITSSLGNGNVNVINSFSQSIGQTVVKYNNIACTFEASATSSTLVRKIYVNGNLTSENTINAPFDPIGAPSYVNIFTDNGAGSNSLQNIQMYQRVLSQAEIKQNLFQAPIVTDGLVFVVDSGNIISYETGSTTTHSLTGSLSGSLINGVGYNQSNGGVWNLDGTDDYIEFLDNSALNFGAGSFTIECFFKPNSTQSGGNFPAVMNKSVGDFTSPSAGVTGWMLFWWTTAGRYYFSLGDSSAAINSIIFPSNVNNDNTWRHLAVTIPSGNNLINGYYNGNLVTSNSRTLTGSTNINVSLTLGTWRQFARELNTELSIARIYNRELTAAEILQNFNAQRTRFNI